MRRWGIVITAFYLCVVVVFLLPGGMILSGEDASGVLLGLFDPDVFLDGGWFAWLIIALFVSAQALLLFLSVDVSRKRLKPRQHVLLSVAVTTFAVGLLAIAVFLSVSVAIFADDGIQDWMLLASPAVSWAVWGVVFYLYREHVSARLDRTVSWLLNGSILQLLIVVPCHIVVRQRGDCSAPFVTGYGIATGVAIMLMAFGPSVLFLYQKRLREYDRESKPAPLAHRRPIAKVTSTLAIGAVTLFFFLPVDDGWNLRLDLSAEQSAELTRDLIDIANTLGMTTSTIDDTALHILCDGDAVVRAQVLDPDSEPPDAWSISIRADRPDLVAELEALGNNYGTEVLSWGDPSALDEWRTKIMRGTLLGGACSPP